MTKWIGLAVLFASLSVSAVFRHRARRSGSTVARREEGGVVMTLRALSALLLIGTIAAHFLIPERMAWARMNPPKWVSWVGVIIGVSTVPLLYWVFVSIGRNISETVLTKSDHELITHGPYHWVRHPLYSSGVTLIASLGLMLNSWVLLVYAGVTVALLRLWVVPSEERHLQAMFGRAYETYKEGTGPLLPTLRG